MECEKCTDDLTAYLDGELSEWRAGEIKAHAEACPSCAAELLALKDSAAFVEPRVHAVELRPEVWQGVRARISAMEAPAPGLGLLGFIEMHRRATAAAALIATVAVVIGLWDYVRYEQSQKQLDQYMNAYIQQREAQNVPRAPALNVSTKQNPAHGAISPVVYRGGYDGNPFLQIDFIPDSNPFRVEAQR